MTLAPRLALVALVLAHSARAHTCPLVKLAYKGCCDNVSAVPVLTGACARLTSAAYDAGYAAGHADGNATGVASAYADGHGVGYAAGYAAGQIYTASQIAAHCGPGTTFDAGTGKCELPPGRPRSCGGASGGGLQWINGQCSCGAGRLTTNPNDCWSDGWTIGCRACQH